MSLGSSVVRRSVIAATAALAACVAMPLEHSNYYDPEGSSTLTITGGPDTVFAIFDTIALSVTSSPAMPAGASMVWQTESGAPLIQWLGGGVFRTTAAVGLLPVPVVISVVAAPVGSPSDTVRIMVRQRPAIVDLLCDAGSPCSALGIAANATLRFTMADDNAFNVNLPPGSYRWGSLVSRSPAIVAVTGRPLPNTASVQGVAAGTAWVVLSGEGIQDSVLVTVIP